MGNLAVTPGLVGVSYEPKIHVGINWKIENFAFLCHQADFVRSPETKMGSWVLEQSRIMVLESYSKIHGSGWHMRTFRYHFY